MYCTFELAASKDAAATITLDIIDTDTGKLVCSSESEHELTADEKNSVSMDLSFNTFEGDEARAAVISISSKYPFTPETEEEKINGQIYVDISEWAATEFEISNMLFYGLQNETVNN